MFPQVAPPATPRPGIIFPAHKTTTETKITQVRVIETWTGRREVQMDVDPGEVVAIRRE